MAWVVDTCVLIDVLENDPLFGMKSAICLQSKLVDGLAIAPVSFIELAPAFMGDQSRQREFLDRMLVAHDYSWSWTDTLVAHQAWARYVDLKQKRKAVKRPIADILIGAFASRFDGLITRNEKDFCDVFANLKIIVPE